MMLRRQRAAARKRAEQNAADPLVTRRLEKLGQERDKSIYYCVYAFALGDCEYGCEYECEHQQVMVMSMSMSSAQEPKGTAF